MTRTARRIVLSLVAAAVVLAACTVLLVKLWPRAPPGVPPDLVPASWAQYRSSPGHVAHVGHATVGCRDCHAIERDGFKNPGASVCATCHAKESTLGHHGGQGTAATDCLTCHVFSPARSAPTCLSCHSAPEGALPAVVQHATVGDCTKCHRLYTRAHPSSRPTARAATTSARRSTPSTQARRGASTATMRTRQRPRPDPPHARLVTRRVQEPHPASHDACIWMPRAARLRRGKRRVPSAATGAARRRWPSTRCPLTGSASTATRRTRRAAPRRHACGVTRKSRSATEAPVPASRAMRPTATTRSSSPRAACTELPYEGSRSRHPAGAHTGAVACSFEGCHKPHAFGG